MKVVLLGWAHSGEDRLRNVRAYSTDGAIAWEAELPADTGRDCFVGLDADGQHLVVTTYSGRRIRLCPLSGSHVDAGCTRTRT